MKLLPSDQAQLQRLFPAATLTLVLAVVLMPSSAHAGDSGQQINFFLLAMNLFGGLAIFLYGMDKIMDFAAYNLQVDIRENLKRIYYHAKRVAKLEAHVEDAAAWNTVDTCILQGRAFLPQELAR